MRPGAGLRASRQRRRRPMLGFPSARGHIGAIAVNVQQLAVIGTSPLHGLLRLIGYLAQSSPGPTRVPSPALLRSNAKKVPSLRNFQANTALGFRTDVAKASKAGINLELSET